ncbi:GCN5-related N-acetyltransferas-like protein [Lophiostoma macrostomum CBS 122681]|uniref:GCN5-related N-acetyltransferas-like protein n=1 Tax=Lophiostoma macrostomum CBS 122681 TaxID=1314788 RepID=A0A6A6THW3_9PLEO|nr:GCN5-related N-acetyltransferas-like protein [Lophiostoma macrostomum CBS 122681]
MTQPFIRPYNNPQDFEACLNIFYTTIDSSVNSEPARTIGSYLWCKSYLVLSPHTCFVLDNGSGLPVGYIIGTPSTTDFASRWEDVLIPIVDPKLVPRDDQPGETQLVRDLKRALYGAECSMLQKSEELLQRYPAHLHVNVLPEYQGRGFGSLLTGKFLERMGEEGVRGVHLGMVRGNEGARRFYERAGWRVCEEVLDGGSSGEVGRDGNALCLLKDL